MLSRLRFFLQYLVYLIRLGRWKLSHPQPPLQSRLVRRSFSVGGELKLLAKYNFYNRYKNYRFYKIYNRYKRYNRYVFLVALFILPTLLILAVYLSRTPKPASAGWFDTGWAYRKKVPITNTSSAQTDYQVMVTVDTAALVTAGKLQSDCDDLRFTNQGGNLLSFWVEPTTCNTTTTKIWVKVPSIPSGSGNTADLYYYGNPSASRAPNGAPAAVFIRDMDSAAVS